MPSRTRLSQAVKPFLALVGATVLVPLPGGASASSSPAFLARAISSDAYGGHLLWARCPSGNCGLYTRMGGVTSRLPIAPLGLPDDAADATLGTGPDGHEVAAYSRCGPSLRNCGLYVYDLVTKVEQRLPVSGHRGAFMTPSVSGARVAYAFNPLGRDGPVRTYGIYWSYLDGTRMYRVHTEPLDSLRTQPTLALSGTRLAYAGASHLTSCLDQTHVRIATLGSNRDTLVATGTDRTDLFSPQWDGQVLYYGRDLFTVASYRHDFNRSEIARSRVERYSLANGETSATRYSNLPVSAVLPDGAQMFFQLVTGHGGTTGLYAADPLRYRRIAAHRRLSRVR